MLPSVPLRPVRKGVQRRERSRGILIDPGIGDAPQRVRSRFALPHRQRIPPSACGVYPGFGACLNLPQVGFYGEPLRDLFLAAVAQAFAISDDDHRRLALQRWFERFDEPQCRIEIVACPRSQGMHQFDRTIALFGNKPRNGRSRRELNVAHIDDRPQRSTFARQGIHILEQIFDGAYVGRSQ